MTYQAHVTTPAALGIALQQARMIKGISQRELADRLGVSQRYIWELESGKDSIMLTRLLAVLKETGATMTLDIPSESDD
jgi:HTH-type transcriptional regulator/antitoxin HipB